MCVCVGVCIKLDGMSVYTCVAMYAYKTVDAHIHIHTPIYIYIRITYIRTKIFSS